MFSMKLKYFMEGKMKIFFRLLLVLLFGAMLLSSCGDDDDNSTSPSDPTMDGSWVGTIGEGTFSLSLSEDENEVTGTVVGTRPDDDESVNGTVSGTNTYPDVSLTIVMTGFNPFTFTGTFSDANTISGVLNGSGFTGESIMFTRQE
jgi:hypothetical protein